LKLKEGNKMKTIAIGLAKGELLEPYDKYFNLDKVKKFHEYINSNDVKRFISNLDSSKYICDNYQNLDKLRIIGSYADACIAYTTGIALRLGIDVICPEDLIFYCDSKETIEESVKKWGSSTYGNLVDLVNKKILKSKLEFDYTFENGIHKFISK